MNRNSENHFQMGPKVELQRSTFLMNQDIRSSFNTGLLIPFFVDADIMPGDTYQVDGTFVIRGTTPIAPTLDNAFADIYWFYDKNNYLWKHWKNFMGENKQGSWSNNMTEYTIPQVKFGYFSSAKHSIVKGDLADYMGLPLFTSPENDSKSLSVNALPFRSYVRIWNNFFRNQNLQAPQLEYNDDNDVNFIPDTQRGSSTYDTYLYSNISAVSTLRLTPAPVNKYADYFTTCNPEPQKFGSVTLPIGQSAPVSVYGNGKSLGLMGVDGNGDTVYSSPIALTNDDLGSKANGYNTTVGTGTSGNQPFALDKSIGVTTEQGKSGLIGTADLSNAVAATINAQRLAFATQRINEKSVFGTRYYLELIPNFWGVTVPGASTDLPEYLGGCRIPITQNQVAQTSSTDAVTPQGNVAAFSLTVNGGRQFTKSFVEHGVLIGLIAVRTMHSYDTGIERQWSRTRKLDYYWPQLCHLGEQNVLVKEIYATGASANDDATFGFQERWAEYKYKPNKNMGAFHTTYAQSLDFWHYGDSYNSAPVLQSKWALENKDAVDRTLAVTSATEDQWLMNANIRIRATRPMARYNTPGLIDHY